MIGQGLQEIIELMKNRKEDLKEVIEERKMTLTDSVGNKYNVVDVRDLELICEYYHQSKL